MNSVSLGYIGVSAKDTAAWRTLATRVLGLMEVEQTHDAMRFRMDDHAWRIAIEAGDDDDLKYIGLEVESEEALSHLLTRLQALGIAVEAGTPSQCAARGVMGMFRCEDPTGLQVEVFYGPDVLTDKRFVSPAGVGKFVTADQGLGHVFLTSPDLASLRRFYMDGFGFRLSDIINMPLNPATPDVRVDLEFYHCNPRHHTIGMAPGGGGKRLHHFMLEVSTLDDVGLALDRAEYAGVPVAIPLGRHSNDQVTSFYLVTPSGFAIEIGSGGIEIDENWRVVRHTTPSSWGHRGLGGR
jgi:2,3-dihydroxybiphenyl 1,2-dioxygenase